MTSDEETLLVDRLLDNKDFVAYMNNRDAGQHVAALVRTIALSTIGREPAVGEFKAMGDRLIEMARRRGFMNDYLFEPEKS